MTHSLQNVPPGTLQPWAKNPRRIAPDAVLRLATSIRELGWGRPILARPSDRTIVAGHRAHQAALLLGLEEVPVVWREVSDAELERLAIADNAHAEGGVWDDELLGEILRDQAAAGYDVDLLGLAEAQLVRLLSEDQAAPVVVPEAPRPPPVRRDPPPPVAGDGPPPTAAVRQGESLELLRELPSASVDAVITDPPYSSGGQFRADRVGGNRKYLGPEGAAALPDFEGDSRDQRAYALWCSIWLTEAHRVCRPGGVVVVATDWRQLGATCDAVQVGGWVLRGIVPWIEPGARPQQGRFSSDAEYFVWGSRGAMASEGECHPGHFVVPTPRDREHPTEKPLEVMRGLVRIVPVGSLVLDPFCGSGTTLVAALAEGRSALGFELSAHYVEVARNRCAEAVLRCLWASSDDTEGAVP